MIKNPDREVKRGERERAGRLKKLTLKEAIRKMEDLLASKLLNSLPVKRRQRPVALIKLIYV